MSKLIQFGTWLYRAIPTTDEVQQLIDQRRAQIPKHPKAHIGINYRGKPGWIYFDEDSQSDRVYLQHERTVSDEVVEQYDLNLSPLERLKKWKERHG